MTEETFLNILSAPYDEFPSNENLLLGLILICKFTNSMNVTPMHDKVRTIKLVRLVGCGITPQVASELHDIGWFADAGYLAWRVK